MQRYYKVTCAKCKQEFTYDRKNPKGCPNCGFHAGRYKGHLVSIGRREK